MKRLLNLVLLSVLSSCYGDNHGDILDVKSWKESVMIAVRNPSVTNDSLIMSLILEDVSLTRPIVYNEIRKLNGDPKSDNFYVREIIEYTNRFSFTYVVYPIKHERVYLEIEKPWHSPDGKYEIVAVYRDTFSSLNLPDSIWSRNHRAVMHPNHKFEIPDSKIIRWISTLTKFTKVDRKYVADQTIVTTRH